MKRKIFLSAPILVAMLLSGCATQTGVQRTGHIGSTYVDPTQSVHGVSSIGIESQDIRAMTDQMVRDLMATPLFGNAQVVPRVIIDDTRFVNESTQMLNVNMLLDRMRIELMRASAGKILFVSRQNVDLVQLEKELKEAGSVESRNGEHRQALAGADYRLIGRITSQVAASRSGIQTNYYSISFEMLDLSTGYAVWGNLYDTKKVGANDTLYQ
jgi:penicillin-binding protein activator